MIGKHNRYWLAERGGAVPIAARTHTQDQHSGASKTRGGMLTRSTDDPESFAFRIEWDSAEGHTQAPRRSPEFAPFLAAIRPFAGEIAGMRNYELTPVRSDGATD